MIVTGSYTIDILISIGIASFLILMFNYVGYLIEKYKSHKRKKKEQLIATIDSRIEQHMGEVGDYGLYKDYNRDIFVEYCNLSKAERKVVKELLFKDEENNE